MRLARRVAGKRGGVILWPRGEGRCPVRRAGVIGIHVILGRCQRPLSATNTARATWQKQCKCATGGTRAPRSGARVMGDGCRQGHVQEHRMVSVAVRQSDILCSPSPPRVGVCSPSGPTSDPMPNAHGHIVPDSSACGQQPTPVSLCLLLPDPPVWGGESSSSKIPPPPYTRLN